MKSREENRRDYILRTLRGVAFQSKATRARAINQLIKDEYTEDEISAALRWEERRIKAEQARIAALGSRFKTG